MIDQVLGQRPTTFEESVESYQAQFKGRITRPSTIFPMGMETSQI